MRNPKHITPGTRGQITIPKEIREKLEITANTRLKIYVEKSKIIIEPVSSLDLLFEDIEKDAKSKGYTEEDLNLEIEAARKHLIKGLYK